MCRLTTAFEVFVHFILMTKIIAEDDVDLIELERGILFGDGFRRRALSECGYDGIESYARTTDTDYTIRIRGKRHGF